nr:MAG TPA: tail sheath protein [Caudoviricetes sp.]
MAQDTQIVPKWNFPHVQSYFNDYTEISTSENIVTPTNTSPHFIAVFTAGEGIDNTFFEVNTANRLRNICGPRDFDKYGQPYSQALATIEPAKGNTVLHAMRVMPEDATYANSYLVAHYKEDVANKKFKIYWDIVNYTGENAPNSDTTYKEKMLTAIEEKDGYKGLIVAAVRSSGRGKYGNNYRWRMTSDANYEKEYGIKMYRIQILKAKNGLTSVFTTTGSACYTDITGTTTYINDIIRDNVNTGEIPAIFEMTEDNFNKLYDAYVEFLEKVQEANGDGSVKVDDISLFDPFFGKYPNPGVANPYIQILPTALTEDEKNNLDNPDSYKAEDYAPVGVTTIAFDAIQGNNLIGGSDGAFEDADSDKRSKAIDQCYINAFSGVYDKRILSALRIPAVALFDANYSFEVKKYLAELAVMRNDAILYLDTGILPSFSENVVTNLIEDYSIFDTATIMDGAINVPCISKNLHHYVIRDAETKRKHTVTFVYYIASIFYNHIMSDGLHIPLANVRCQLADHVKDSLAPTVEIFEDKLRERFTTARFNWCEAAGPNIFRRVCQLTAQTPTSDVIEENNVHTLFELKRDVENECRERLYSFTDAEMRAGLAEYIQAQHRSWIGSKLESLKIVFKQNQWEGERSIIHGYIEVVFRGLVKRITLEFDINKRDYSNQ